MPIAVETMIRSKLKIVLSALKPAYIWARINLTAWHGERCHDLRTGASASVGLSDFPRGGGKIRIQSEGSSGQLFLYAIATRGKRLRAGRSVSVNSIRESFRGRVDISHLSAAISQYRKTARIATFEVIIRETASDIENGAARFPCAALLVFLH